MRLGTLNALIPSLLALTLATAGAVAGDMEAGRQKAATCVVCHGADGNSNNPAWPNLAGQHAEYLEKQLLDFREGRRENAQMAPIVMSLTDQDIADLAAYYAAQTHQVGATQPENVELGQRLYRAGDGEKGLAACMACHGPAGSGNPAAKYPRINGQHAAYTATQLKAFKAEQRVNDQNGIMRDLASRMSNDSIDAVADYLQGLH